MEKCISISNIFRDRVRSTANVFTMMCGVVIVDHLTTFDQNDPEALLGEIEIKEDIEMNELEDTKCNVFS